MDTGKRGGKSTVVRGVFGKPKHGPSTIRRRNANATASLDSALPPSPSGITAELGHAEGQIFRALELVNKAEHRAAVNAKLVELLQGARLEDLAWEFVTSPELDHVCTCPLEDAAKAQAFLVLAYGTYVAN